MAILLNLVKCLQHGHVWRSNVCTNCHCDNGVVGCHVEECGNDVECPKVGHKLTNETSAYNK